MIAITVSLGMLFGALACGSRSGLDIAPAPPVLPDAGCVPVDDACGTLELCDDGNDDDCDGRVDETCACEPGAVQSCFAGPPGRRDVGACADGEQTCGLDHAWGECVGGILPGAAACNGADSQCDGCSEQQQCPILCPSPGDPRVPDGAPFTAYPLRARDFFAGTINSVQWTVLGGPCDQVATNASSFTLTGATQADATFTPRLSGEYTVTLDIVAPGNVRHTCTWIVHVEGPGLRVEMCYPESEDSDVDLLLHRPNSTTDWYPPGGTALNWSPDTCSWLTCEAMQRGSPVADRADWGYAHSPLSECVGGPQGEQWRALGFCANPRLDIDNDLSQGIGVPENINIDRPRDGETFRVMLQNFSGGLAHPLVNVYCAGRRVATFGAPPDTVQRFEGSVGFGGIGAMWRVTDITVHVNDDETTCDAVLLHPPGQSSGYFLTYDDPRY